MPATFWGIVLDIQLLQSNTNFWVWYSFKVEFPSEIPFFSKCYEVVFVCRFLLESSSFDLFFDYVELSNFDIASDAFMTFKVGNLYLFSI